MRITLKAIAGMAAVLLTAGVARAADGVLIVQKMTPSGGTATTNQIQIEPNRMRAEVTPPSGTKMAVIYDAAKQSVLLVDDAKRTYTEMNKADLDRLAGQVNDMMSQMQAAMANMPPAQRAQMEAMMRGRMGGMAAAAAPPKITYTKIGTDKVGKWTCDKYEGKQDGQHASEICTVDANTIGLTAADMTVFTQLAGFFKQLAPSAADMVQLGGAGAGFPGVPVRTVQSSMTIEITDVTRQTFPATLFQPPAGYTKQDMMGGMGRGRGF